MLPLKRFGLPFEKTTIVQTIPSILVLILLVKPLYPTPTVAASFLKGYELHTNGLTNYFLSAK